MALFELFADFNDIDEGIVSGLQRYVRGHRALRPADRVLVRDGDGNRCWGNVVRVDSELVDVMLDDSTWLDALPERTLTINAMRVVVYETKGLIVSVDSGNDAEAATRPSFDQ
jgi:hypothetical protein